MTHYGGCAVLFNKDTFFSDIKVSSFYLHNTRACEQDKITEGESGWVMQGVVSRAALRRQPHSSQKSFTVMSLHTNNNCAKKRGIWKKFLLTIRAIMQEEHVDLVASDFDGAAWSYSICSNPQLTSIFEEAFADTNFPMSPGPTPSWPSPLVQFLANGPMSVSSSPPSPIRTMYVRFVHTGPSQFLENSWASVREIRVATTKCGYTWTLSAIGMLTSHEEIASNVSSSRKGPAPTRLQKRKEGTTMKVTIRFHPCHSVVSPCFHKQ